VQTSSVVEIRLESKSGAQDRWFLLCITALATVLFTLRLAAPPNLLDQDQENPAAYVLDAVKNGNWICQRDLAGAITSKPPLYTWLAAAFTTVSGEISLATLYLPGALALFGTACLVLALGRRHFGPRAGFYAALACMLCTAGLKQFGLARTDGVFAFTVAAAAFLAFSAWRTGAGWTWFWLMGAAATLTKGPLGLVLGAMGLIAVLWEKRSGRLVTLNGSHLVGVLLFTTLTVSWLGLSFWQLGWPVIDKLFLQELVFHVVEGEQKKMPGSMFYLSPLYYLGRAAPWSLLACYGFWRIWRAPAANSEERSFERFLFCWFVGGLAIFSIAPHQRGDLLWPIIPAGALVAGRELQRLVTRWDGRKTDALSGALFVLAIAGFGFYYFGPRAKHPLVQQTIAIRELSRNIRQQSPGEFPLTHTDDPTALQVYLNTWHQPVSFQQAAALLRGPEAAFVAVTDWAGLQAARTAADPAIYTVLQDTGRVARLKARIVSNRPVLNLSEGIGLASGPWLIRYQGRLMEASADAFSFVSNGATDRVSATNQGSQSRQVRLRISTPAGVRNVVRTLAAGETLIVRTDS
jgi:4-amino-4-deoxy-L-arabinose transferase-like glycosyltransferase